MGQKKTGALTQQQLEFIGELYLKGELEFKKNKPLNKNESKWVIKMMNLIRTSNCPPRKAQIAVSETKEFIEWNKKRSKIKKNQEYQHFKDAENLWSKYMRLGGIMRSLKRNKIGSVKGVKKGNTRKNILGILSEK